MQHSLFCLRAIRDLRHLAGAAITACLLLVSPAPATARDDIAIAGSTTVYPILARAARQFQDLNDGVTIVVGSGGSGRGITALIAGEVDIAASSRFISRGELEYAVEHEIYPVPFRIADDCILPIVHKSNRVRDLSLEQLKGIYAGRISNWKELGGPDRAIAVISRNEASGTSKVWNELVMEGEQLVSTRSTLDTSSDVVRAVAENRSAIGYVGLGYLSANVKPLRVNGVMGSLASMRDGSYLLNRPLFLFTRGWPAGRVLEFVNYVLAPDAGQRIVEDMGFIPLYNQ